MARLADYFIVVGYDQEKAGKFSGGAARRLNCGAEVCCSGQCVMLMLDSFALSFTLATQLPGETGNTFLFSFTRLDTEYHPAGVCLQIKLTS